MVDSIPALSRAGTLVEAPCEQAPGNDARPPRRPRGPSLNEIYALPAPIRTFPLPSFYPNNPLSIFHLVYAWAKQVLSPPPAEPSVTHTGIWDPDSRSVHVIDPVAVRALWEQGFYGKGNLSRSEPNWLKREQIRKGKAGGDVSEQRTALRREERRQVKWERARTEQEALERTRREEAQLAASSLSSTLLSSEAGLVDIQVKPEPSHVSNGAARSIFSANPSSVDSSFEAAKTLAEKNIVKLAPSVPEPEASSDNTAEASHSDDITAYQDTPPNTVLNIRLHPTPVALGLTVATVAPEFSNAPSIYKAPVGPLETLALPNSRAEIGLNSTAAGEIPSLNSSKAASGLGSKLKGTSVASLSAYEASGRELSAPSAPVGPLELLALPNSSVASIVNERSHGLQGREDDESVSAASLEEVAEEDDSPSQANGGKQLNGHANGSVFGALITGTVLSEVDVAKYAIPENGEARPSGRRRKSVRFSATVESNTFSHGDPPSPDSANGAAKRDRTLMVEPVAIPKNAACLSVEASAREEEPKDAVPVAVLASELPSELDTTAPIIDKEHLQLSTEEAFFLAYGIGALTVLDREAQKPIPREQLLGLFRANSYFPSADELQPSDPFLIHYVVYHHFRSLGWVPRHGIKFGVDWMLYTRGPVFDHAEFGLIVLPSYSHPWWKDTGHKAPHRPWNWLHGVNRVLSHVLKSLVLVYVDVPPPQVFEASMAAGGISAALKEYRVREFMVRRWSSNRNR